MSTEARQQVAQEELAEQFANAPLREVSCEIRFDPKLRIGSEIWRLQEALSSVYPTVGTEPTLTSVGLVQGHFFLSTDGENRIVASQTNFGLIQKRYSGFDRFLGEVVSRCKHFCSLYDISSLTRVGLRYNNQFLLPDGDRVRLAQWVNPFLDLARIDLASTHQFVVELRSIVGDHGFTARTALLNDPAPAYVLDFDCYVERLSSPDEIEILLPKFHDRAKRAFLEHIKPALKDEFRRRPQR
jgi:uncharacterized protein (TIGR04255 family)